MPHSPAILSAMMFNSAGHALTILHPRGALSVIIGRPQKSFHLYGWQKYVQGNHRVTMGWVQPDPDPDEIIRKESQLFII
jgi:hypothetical protein